MFDHRHQIALLDSSGLIYRSYFASLAQDSAYNVNHRGEPIGALKNFAERLYWMRKKGIADSYPTHFAAVFDFSRRSFRHDLYPAYKAGRPETPDDLKAQMPLLREAAIAMGVQPVEEPGVESDDVICTLSHTAVEMGGSVIIISADKDMAQVVRDRVLLFDPESGVPGYRGYRPERRYDRAGVIEKFGVPPELVVDVQALAGDPSDGIPGVPGIGMKTATELVQTYGDLEAVLAAAPSLKQSARRQALIANADLARLCKKLVTLSGTVDYTFGIEELELAPLDNDRALAFAELHGLTSLARRITKNIEWDESH